MITPRMGQQPPEGQPWAADNGRYASPQNYDDETYLDWLRRMEPHRALCLFATAPDVVGDAAATLALSAPMYARIRAEGYKPALVAQDGLLPADVPWDDIDALFIGGSTAWKLGEAAHRVAAAALLMGKWLHMGRVNSLRRMRLAMAMGCDSADGTFLRFGPDVNEPRLQSWLADLERQPQLGLR